MAKHKKEKKIQHINKTQCLNNLTIWQFYDKTSLHKPTQTLILEFT